MEFAFRPGDRSSCNPDCTTAFREFLARYRDPPCDDLINVVHIWTIPAVLTIAFGTVHALMGRHAISILTSGPVNAREFFRQARQSPFLFDRKLAIMAERTPSHGASCQEEAPAVVLSSEILDQVFVA